MQAVQMAKSCPVSDPIEKYSDVVKHLRRSRIENRIEKLALKGDKSFLKELNLSIVQQSLEEKSGLSLESLELSKNIFTQTPCQLQLQGMLCSREEVPFERFATDYPRVYKGQISGLRIRAICVLHTLEGATRLAAHVALAAFKKIMEVSTSYKFKVSSDIHWKVAKAQATGVKYSGYAVISPAGALASAKLANQIGCDYESWEWGTPYKGTRSFYCLGVYDDSKKEDF